MRPGALGSLVALLAASPLATAQVSPPTVRTEATRVAVGVTAGQTAFGDKSLTTPGGGAQGSGAVGRVGATFSVEQRLSDRWWFAAVCGLSQSASGAGVDAGYTYGRVDVGVAPRFEIYRWPFRVATPELHLAFPIGLSKTFVDVPLRRAFSEQVDSSWGWHGGGTLSVTVLFHVLRRRRYAPSPGVRAGFGYLRHASHRRTTFTPGDAAQEPTVEETDVVDHDLLFTVAGVLAF